MEADESAATRGRWAAARESRYRVAAWLAVLGTPVWAFQAFAAWIQSQEGKWQDAEYLSVGDSAINADDLLVMLSIAFLTIAVFLGRGARLLLRGKVSGRYLILAGAWLVLLGQLFAAVLAWIPIDAFYYSAPANLVFVTTLVVFPLATIMCLTDGMRLSATVRRLSDR